MLSFEKKVLHCAWVEGFPEQATLSMGPVWFTAAI